MWDCKTPRHRICQSWALTADCLHWAWCLIPGWMKTGKFSVALRTTARPGRDQPGPAQQAVVAPCAVLHLILFSVNLCVFAPHYRHHPDIITMPPTLMLYNNLYPCDCSTGTAVSRLCLATYLLAQMFLRKWSESDSLHFALYSLVISFNYELVTFHESLWW